MPATEDCLAARQCYTIHMTIELPDVKIGSESLTSVQARIEIACGLYAGWRVSLPQAARIAGMSRILFMQELGRRRIPLQYTPEDLRHDFEMADKLARNGVPA
jgi:predicted HTH domain antitoxin